MLDTRDPPATARTGRFMTALEGFVIFALLAGMTWTLRTLDRRANLERDESTEIASLDGVLHLVDGALLHLGASSRTDPGAPPRVGELVALAQTQVRDLSTENDTERIYLQIDKRFDGYRAAVQRVLSAIADGSPPATTAARSTEADFAREGLDEAVQAAWLAVRQDSAQADRLRDRGSATTLGVGGLLLLLVLFRGGRARRRFFMAQARSTGLEESAQRFLSLMSGSADLVFVLARDARVLFQGPSVTDVLGWAPDELLGRDFRSVLDPDDARGIDAVLDRVEDGTHPRETTDWRVRSAGGEFVSMEAVLMARFDDPRIGGILVNLRDVSERLRLEEALRHRAFHDPLTGLANRVLFEDRLEHALERTVRRGGATCVLMLDLDFFKDVNDSYGHAAGDQVLVETAERLKRAMRPEDTLARFGGDEFAVLVEEVSDERDGAKVAERILRSLEEPFAIQDVDVFLQASIGVVAASDAGESRVTRDEVMLEADLAMYEAKRQGRGGFRFFAPEMQQSVRDRMLLKSDLQRGLRRGEFILHYQPIVSIESAAISGGEALVRWEHPTRGLVPPLEFIPMAEETGMILELGRWVLREACREAAGWRIPAGGDLLPYVSVNVAGSQLQHGGFVDDVREALADAALEPGRLVIEVTESALIEDSDGNQEKLEQLRGLGVRLAIDDFGTGYSSLNYLRRFNMDILKIDKTFVEGLGHESAGRESALVSAMVAMGTSLDMKVVAEGIEEPVQLDDLRMLQCQFGQGFLFAKPVPAADFDALLQSIGLPVHSGAGAA